MCQLLQTGCFYLCHISYDCSIFYTESGMLPVAKSSKKQQYYNGTRIYKDSPHRKPWNPWRNHGENPGENHEEPAVSIRCQQWNPKAWPRLEKITISHRSVGTVVLVIIPWNLNVAIYGNGCSNGCSNMRCNDIFIIFIIVITVIIFIFNAFSPKPLTEMQTTYVGEQRTAVWREHGTAIRTAMVTMGSPWQSMAVLVRWLSYFSSQSCLAPRLFFRTLLGNVEICWKWLKFHKTIWEL